MNGRCDKCHEVLTKLRITSENDPYCQHCGHVFGTSVQPSVWTCEECGEVILGLKNHDERPWCSHCKTPLSCVSAQPSRIYGAGTGDADLDLGSELLREAQMEFNPHLKHPCDDCDDRNTVYCGPECDRIRKQRNGQTI